MMRLFGVLVTMAIAAFSVRDGAAQGVANVDESRLRGMTVMAPMPEYPRASLTEKVTGVVVSQVVFAPDGRFERVEILQAPDEHTAATVRTAVGRWSLTPGAASPRGDPAPARRGKLTFYFRIDEGTGRVLNPDQMPGAVAPRAGSTPAASEPSSPGIARQGGALKTVTPEALKALSGAAAPFVLDIGERDAFARGHWPGALNIPVDELPVRGGPELPRSQPIVIDCTQEQRFRCEAAGAMLAQQHFTNVMLLVR